VKYNERNYNRLKERELYDSPFDAKLSGKPKKARIMSRSGKTKRPSKRAMQWMEDLLAK